jgi:hypothetical protein
MTMPIVTDTRFIAGSPLPLWGGSANEGGEAKRVRCASGTVDSIGWCIDRVAAIVNGETIRARFTEKSE